MSNTITIELCAEDRARLDKLADRIAELDKTILATSGAFNVAALPETRADAEAAAAELQAATKPADKPESKPQADAPQGPTADELKALVLDLIGRGGEFKTQATALVKQYAPKLSAVPEDKRAELYAALRKLNFTRVTCEPLPF